MAHGSAPAASDLTGRQRAAARLIWDYHRMRHELRPCDAAVALGNHDLGVPAYSAELFRAGLFPVLVFSGGLHPTAPARFPRGEAVHYREHAAMLAVPSDAILVEPDATNTGQNIAFSRQVMAKAGIRPASLMLVAMPFMERRAYATARKVWPEAEAVCASPPVGFDDYLKGMGDKRRVAETLVGNLQRVMEYPKLGFAVEQEVPAEVHDAYQALVRDGFTSRLLH